MDNISFDIAKHWLPISEKQGSIEGDSLRVKVSGINFHTKAETSFWGIFTGYIKREPTNPHDPNAIAFYKTDEQLLGYVQKELQDYVTKFTKGRELDCIIAITPFVSSEGTICNQAYATIIKFFEDDIDYAKETINAITENVGNDALIEITHFENNLPSLKEASSRVDETDEDEEDCNTIFRYDEFYKFPQSDKTGKKTYDTLTVKIENADWYFDREKWPAGVFSGYVDIVHLDSSNKYGIYRDDNTLVGCPNSFDFDNEIEEFAEGHRIYCVFKLTPHIDNKSYCIDISGKAVLIKFFENEMPYASKLFEDTRTRLAQTAVTDYKKFIEKKEDIERGGDSVLLSWGFGTRRYTFGDKGPTCSDDNGNLQKPKSGCLGVIALLFALIGLILCF